MVRVNSLPYRLLALEQGADIVYSEGPLPFIYTITEVINFTNALFFLENF